MRDSWKTQSLIFILYTHTRMHTHIHTDREKWLGGQDLGKDPEKWVEKNKRRENFLNFLRKAK